jgi:hypothetical protein
MIDTTAKNKLVSYIKKRHPNIDNQDIPRLLNDVRRFVTVVQKIYIEPQAKILIKEVNKNGKKEKTRFINTNIEELKKIKRPPGEPITVNTIREMYQKITGNKSK